MRTILLAEDDPTIRELVVIILTREGHAVTAVESGAQAWKLAQDQPPDVIVLDGRLPEMSGREVCERVRADNAIGSVPVLMLTGSVASADIQAGLAAGANVVLSKPFSPEALLAAINTLSPDASAEASADAAT